MSGDVQPKKRKDKKKKKDELGLNEPRGTAAALGDGDVFMHSHHDHGTGGHWCAKVIFFSLLAILIGLVGLIILENRGLSELEANAVQSQYSGVLEGWLEDAPEDDHHDEHTLELKHHDDENDADHDEGVDHSDETEVDERDEENDHNEHLEEGGDEEEYSEEQQDDKSSNDSEENEGDDDEEEQDDDDDEEQDDEEEQDNEGVQDQDIEANDEEEDVPFKKYYHENEVEPNFDDEDDDDNDDEEQEDDHIKDDEEDNEEDRDLSNEADQEDDNSDNEEDSKTLSGDVGESQENDDQDEENTEEYNTPDNEGHNNKDEDEHEEDDEEDTSLEVEKIEQEAAEDEEPISVELPALPESDDDDDGDDNKALESVEDDATEADDDDTIDEPDDNFLEADDDEPPIERITAPAGKPFTEVEEEESTEKPTDTLAEEEAYEKRQEELRREEAQASHMWLKLSIGGALLVATHAIVRRATASSDVPQTERPSREEAPATDRRMTLIAEEPSEAVPIRKVTQESTRPVIQEVAKQIPSIVKSSSTFEESEEEVEEEEEPDEPVVSKAVHAAQSAKQAVKVELYSDEEEADNEEIEEEEEKVVVKKVAPQAAKQPTPEPELEEDVPDDVEIIDDEQIEEEAEEEDEDEEEISDVDDEELLSRLEAKYGRLPEPERPQRHKDGGNSIEDDWPGEPSDSYWRQQLDQAEQEFAQGAWLAAADRASAKTLQSSARARLIVAKALDAAAEHKRDNVLLGRAIAAYLELLKMNERLSDKKLLQVAERTINRIQFRGTYLNAEPVYKLLIRRFPDDSSHRTNLTVTFLMANRADLAEDVLKETLKRWPDDRLALAQYGFVLKTQHNRHEEAVKHLLKALEGDTGPAAEPRFYYHLGDTLLLLGRFEEAHEVHKRAAAHGHFLSPAQRSLYNVPRLTGRPWWSIEDTPYVKLARALEKSWRNILKEGEAAKASYEQEKEGLKERGEWSQLDLFARGREIPGRCARAPATCALVRAERAAAGCRRGQVKFSAMAPGTRVRAHTGPTNCRLRMHLGLSNTKDTFIRVHQETRQWEEGKVFLFDDSFEHEVWHNGTGTRLVLIVDVWHPELTPAERRQLPAI